MGLFDAIDIAGSGLAAERVRMDVTAENLANAQSTKTPAGGPYKRQEVVSESIPAGGDFGATLEGAMEAQEPGQLEIATSQSPAAGGVQVGAIVDSKAPDQLIYDPSNPEANAKGYVTLPNVDTVTEMTDLIAESRSYQADVTAMQTSKAMFNTTLGLLK
jgi:flagellar basal-body rod protein FlgC